MGVEENKAMNGYIRHMETFAGKFKSHVLWKFIVQIASPLFAFGWQYVIHFQRKLLCWTYFVRYPGTGNAGALRADGIEIVSASPAFVEFAHWLRSRIPAELLLRHKQKMLMDDSAQAFCASLGSELDVDTRVKILEFCLSREVLEPTLKYFGLVPRLSSVLVMYNIPKPGEGRVGSKEWHRDDSLYKSLNLFMCLSDVDDDSGAYYAIPQRYLPRHADIPIEQLDPRLSAWKRFRYSTEMIQRYVPSFRPLRLAGPAGTSAFVDPGLCFHRGGHCTVRDRLMIQIAFTLDTPWKQSGVVGQLALAGHPVVEKLRRAYFYRLLLDGNAGSPYWKLGIPNPIFFISRRVLSYYLRSADAPCVNK